MILLKLLPPQKGSLSAQKEIQVSMCIEKIESGLFCLFVWIVALGPWSSTVVTCRDSQLLKHTVLVQASQRQFTSI